MNGKMKSTIYHTNRLRDVTSEDDESRVTSFTSSEVHPSTICHCHCSSLSHSDVSEDNVVLTSSTKTTTKTTTITTKTTTMTTVCDLCERLSGRTTSRDLVDALRTENDQCVTNRKCNRPKRKHNVTVLSKCEPRVIQQHDGVISKYNVPSFCEPLARCVSNVVRWKLANRFPGITTDLWRLIWMILFIILVVPAFAVTHQHTAVRLYNNDGACQSIDIRNSVEQFAKLKGCRVVEGFVQILLIDRAEHSAYTNLSFPELVEITGYLLLYRVSGLKSVGHLFPNLTVIRGQSLFINYALVAFEMMHLQEIGLRSLTNILRGSVRFEKNPLLCNANTIDWDIIAKAGKGEHVISANKPINGCPVCNKTCPPRHIKPDETLCWNQEYCQRICDPKCGENSCDDTGACCHPSCLGKCTGPNANDCVVCKNVMVNGGRCADHCPPNTYKFMDRRCLSRAECRGMPRPREISDSVKDHPYKLFNNTCVIECPAGFMDDDNIMTCKQCNKTCLKECPALNVDSIASAQRLRGCTHIRGSLEIQIRGGKNIVKELEDNLNMIEEIDGHLKIVRSFPLISLNFLKNLRLIRGIELDNGKYSLTVLDNQNLQELWSDENKNITILSVTGPAKVFFHFNPKLCLEKIETLRQKARLNKFTDLEVASNSNGDKVACNVIKLNTQVLKKTSLGAIIEWHGFMHYDTRSLLGYVVYFTEANQNVTMYDSRDACGGDGWRVEDVSAESYSMQSIYNNVTKEEEMVPVYTHILTILKPYTRYAYYVKTYTIATERSGAQSVVEYFTTLPDTPSEPLDITIWSNSSSELVISWLPPIEKNGNVTHYRIVGHLEPEDANFLAQRNYCEEPMDPFGKEPFYDAEKERKRIEEKVEAEKSQTEIASCNCVDSRETDQSLREKEVSSSIAFENALHNKVYIKRINTRRRRETGEIPSEQSKDFIYDEDEEECPDKMKNGTCEGFVRLIPSTNLTFVARNLQHYSSYIIEIQACRERVKDEDLKKSNCSTKSMKTGKTLPMENADNIPPNTFRLTSSGENNSLTVVTLYWDEPPKPNGLILTYQIEYKRVDIKNIKATVICITRRDFVKANNSYILKDLPAGNYTVKVRATSLSGYGEYTEVKYFDIREYGMPITFWIFFWLLLFVIIVFGFFGVFYVFKRKLMRNVPSMRLIATVNPDYVSTVYVPDEWEVPRDKIELLKELGNGSFGMVYQGIAKDVVDGKPEVQCAVKTVNENATDRQRIEFLNEASVMKAFDTHHVVRLLGVVSQGQPTLVVMELMANGDLKSYLRSHRPDTLDNFSRQPPTLKRILQMAIEIADGMAYLATKKFVHRDLAARNCMVAEELTVKIGDFGMTRDIYETDYYRKGTKGLLPVRWMAPESLKDGMFSSYSDVWSYGVVLWEMVTLASQPYQGLSNDQVLRYVIDGGVMERPENCPDSLYNLMRRTWSHKTTKRPTFIDIATILLPEIDVEAFEKVSFYHSAEGIEARNQNNSHSPQADRELEMINLHRLEREEEAEIEESSPLRQDFDDFANFEPASIRNTLSPRYGINSYCENSKTGSSFHDMNSSKVPLRTDFDDFDGASVDSFASSKDTLNLPFAEDSLKSVKSSPFIRKRSTSRGNVSQISLGNSGSPHSMPKPSLLDSPNPSKSRNNPIYENRSPEIVSDADKENTPLHVDFPSTDVVDLDISNDRNEGKHPGDCANKPLNNETLNNGYIGNATT